MYKRYIFLLEAIRKSKINTVQKNSEVAERKKKQPIFASSSTVYKEAIAKPTPENSPLYPPSFYGATKLAGEAIVSGDCQRPVV
jgi:nucleoside-diphosphate-sugar epimerase